MMDGSGPLNGEITEIFEISVEIGNENYEFMIEVWGYLYLEGNKICVAASRK